MDNNVSAKEFEVYQQSIDDMLNVIQLIIDEEQQHNIQQDLRIKDIQDQLNTMSQQLEDLRSVVKDFQDHMDNGWRQGFLDMMKDQLQYVSKELQDVQIQQSKMQNSAMVEEMKAVYDSFIEINEKKKDKHTIDWNQILIGQLGTGGIIFIVVEFILRFFQ